MGIFGKSKKEAWQELAKSISAKYVDGSLFKGSRVEYTYKDWMIYLDTYTVSTGKSSVTYTRMRAPFININNFQFKIYKKGIFSNVGKALGMQDIEVGCESFDNDFIIKGNNEESVKNLFLNYEIRDLIEKQSRIKFEVKKDEGSFGPKFKDNESELYFLVTGVIKDIDILQNLFLLFTKVLDEFEVSGITINITPQVKLYKE
ncbi:MAG: DUF3137 domain-containing protein [Clostridiaceae bacterium]